MLLEQVPRDDLALDLARAFVNPECSNVAVERFDRHSARHATDSAQQVIDKAVQIFGGLGVTSGVPVERLYREIRALRIYEGASEVQKIVIARHHLAGHRR